MSRTIYVRVILIRSIGRSLPKRQQALGDGAWIEGDLIKAVRLGDTFRIRCVFANARLCKRTYASSAVISIKEDIVTTGQMQYMFLRVPRFNSEGSLRAWE
jgi:hypothetical protein